MEVKCEETRDSCHLSLLGPDSYLPVPHGAPPCTYPGSIMALAVLGNLYPCCHPCFTNGVTETQGSLEAPRATQGLNPGLSNSRVYVLSRYGF